eukprot:gene14548-17193_t
MVSIAPTPLYLPVEEANKIFKSPIPQRREFAFSSITAVGQDINNTVPSITTQTTEQKPYYSIVPKVPRPNARSVARVAPPHIENNIPQITLIKQSERGLPKYSPVLLEENSLGGGVYFLRGSNGDKLAIFKPKDEENGLISSSPLSSPLGLKAGTWAGEGVNKEVAAYLFDQRHGGFFNVPVTTLVELYHPRWRSQTNGSQEKKLGSLQQYIPFEGTAEEIGCSRFSVADVHSLGLLDTLLFNCDRHSGNILVVCKDEQSDKLSLVPIDHSLTLPSSNTLSDAWFDWINFPQASVPFDEQTKNLILSIDVDSDIRYLKAALPDLRTQCLETLKLTTIFVQMTVEAGLTLHQIGKFMSRFFDLGEPSALEQIINEVVEKGNRIALGNHSFWSAYKRGIQDLISNTIVKSQ